MNYLSCPTATTGETETLKQLYMMCQGAGVLLQTTYSTTKVKGDPWMIMCLIMMLSRNLSNSLVFKLKMTCIQVQV